MRTLVLDTCIIQYLFRSDSRKAMDGLLALFRQQHNVEVFVVSEFTKFELLRGSRNIKDTTQYLEGFRKTEKGHNIFLLKPNWKALTGGLSEHIGKREKS